MSEIISTFTVNEIKKSLDRDVERVKKELAGVVASAFETYAARERRPTKVPDIFESLRVVDPRGRFGLAANGPGSAPQFKSKAERQRVSKIVAERLFNAYD